MSITYCTSAPFSFQWWNQLLHSARPAALARVVEICHRRLVLGRVAVVVLHPRHRERQPVFVAALWHAVEHGVDAEQPFEATAVRGVRVEDLARATSVEHAETRRLLARKVARLEVVERPASRHV